MISFLKSNHSIFWQLLEIMYKKSTIILYNLKHFDKLVVLFDMKPFRKYFDLSDHDGEQSLGISISNIGYHIHPKFSSYPDISHPDSHYFDWEKGRSLKEFQMLYIPTGEGYFEATGMKPQKISPGTVLMLYPDIWHRYKPNENTGWEEYWVGFTGAYAHFLLEHECFSPQNPVLKLGFNNAFFETFSKLIDTVESKDDSYRKLSSFLLINLLGIVYTSALLHKEKQPQKEDLIQKALLKIGSEWNQAIDFQRLSDEYNMSYVWFRKTFKEVTGTSPGQYLLLLKIRKAEALIVESSKTISEIAFMCGFESESYFTRIFKQKTGYLPSELRKPSN